MKRNFWTPFRYLPYLVSSTRRKAFRLFDDTFYGLTYPDISGNGLDCFLHYTRFGYKEGRSPHPLFSPDFVKNQVTIPENTDPFEFYLANPNLEINPHPLFDRKFLERQLGTKLPKEITALEFFLTSPIVKHTSPTPYFDSQYYLQTNPDVAKSTFHPFLHYLTYGENEGRKPNIFFVPHLHGKPDKAQDENIMAYHGNSILHYSALKKEGNPNFGNFYQNLDRIEDEEQVMLFVSHEASRTGAPLIILKIAEFIEKRHGILPVFFILKNGELFNDFQQMGPSFLIQGANPTEIDTVSKTLLDKIGVQKIIAAYVNSAESRHLLPSLRQCNIYTSSLVHEMANLYPDNEWRLINDCSDKIIFPSKAVQRLAIKHNNIDSHKQIIRGQGLLKPNILNIDKEHAQAVLREKLNIDEGTAIVIGCGTKIARKGVDLFLSTAISYLNTYPNNKIMFLWIGGDSENDHYYWVEKDLEKTEHKNKILFHDSVEDPDLFFAGSDIFFMTSRADPFPCVVHEGMAAQLPVICFEGGGGFTELVDDESGICVPYGNILKAVEGIRYYITSPEKKRAAGLKAREIIQSDYNYEDYVFDLINFLPQNIIKKIPEANKTNIHQDEKPQVIFTLPDWWISGVNTFVETLIKGLNERGFDAYILFTTNQAKAKIEDGDIPPVPYRFLYSPDDSPGSILSGLTSYLERNAPCVFVPNYDYLASSISPGLSEKVGILGVLHSDDVEHYEHAYRLGLYWNRIVSVSKTINNKLLQYNASFADKSSVIYYGIDDDEIKKTKVPKNDVFSIIYTGRIIQDQKRILDFVPIIRLFASQQSDFVFTFIGDGPEKKELHDELKDFIEKGQVRILGKQPKEVIYKELNSAHAFALCSDFEGLPLSLLEALAAGCVPVVTDIKSGIGEIIKHNNNGLISPIGDTESFAQNLMTLVSTPEKWRSLSNQASETLNEYKLTRDGMSEKYTTLLRDIYRECREESFVRTPLTYKSSIGDILLPPSQQKIIKF